MTPEPDTPEPVTYELVLTPPAVRAIQSRLGEQVAAAVVELMTGPLVENLRRVGKELRRDLAGVWSARRGTYRVLYRINEEDQEVVVAGMSTDDARLPDGIGHRTEPAYGSSINFLRGCCMTGFWRRLDVDLCLRSTCGCRG